jgi:hypothetical protein
MEHQAIYNTHSSVKVIRSEVPYDSDDNEVTINQSLVDTELTRLQAEYDSLSYARSRKQEYDKLNQWEMQFDDNRDGTTTWVDSINAIKQEFPK